MQFSILVGIFIGITLLYFYRIRNNFLLVKKHLFLFFFMLLYIVLYHSVPSIYNMPKMLHRYLYIFIYFPLSAYFIIIFPHSVLIPAQKFFPELEERLAIKALVVMAWISLFVMFALLYGIKML